MATCIFFWQKIMYIFISKDAENRRNKCLAGEVTAQYVHLQVEEESQQENKDSYYHLSSIYQ